MRKSRQDLINDYKGIPKSVLADLRKKAPLMKGGLDIKGGVDVNALLVMQGRSDVVLHIYRMIGLDPYEEREEKASIGE
jgi:hypothetical protein